MLSKGWRNLLKSHGARGSKRRTKQRPSWEKACNHLQECIYNFKIADNRLKNIKEIMAQCSGRCCLYCVEIQFLCNLTVNWRHTSCHDSSLCPLWQKLNHSHHDIVSMLIDLQPVPNVRLICHCNLSEQIKTALKINIVCSACTGLINLWNCNLPCTLSSFSLWH